MPEVRFPVFLHLSNERKTKTKSTVYLIEVAFKTLGVRPLLSSDEPITWIFKAHTGKEYKFYIQLKLPSPVS